MEIWEPSSEPTEPTIKSLIPNPGDYVKAGDFIETYRGLGIYVHTGGTYENFASLEIRCPSGTPIDNTTWTYRLAAEAHADAYCASPRSDCPCGAATAKTYHCDPTSHQCIDSPSCTVDNITCFSDSGCNQKCTAPPPPTDGTGQVCKRNEDCVAWNKGDFCLMSSCYKKNNIIMVVGGLAAIMIFMKMSKKSGY